MGSGLLLEACCECTDNVQQPVICQASAAMSELQIVVSIDCVVKGELAASPFLNHACDWMISHDKTPSFGAEQLC